MLSGAIATREWQSDLFSSTTRGYIDFGNMSRRYASSNAPDALAATGLGICVSFIGLI